MSFFRPELLPILLAAPLTGLLLWALGRGRRRRLAHAVGPRAVALAGRRRTRSVLFAGALLLALLAMVQPLWGGRLERRGVDIVVCLDVSRSMLARDVAPSRLERAKAEIRELTLRATGDRLGLVLFAGDARLAVPLTRDLASFRELAALADPLSIERGGSDLGAAITAAFDVLDEDETVLLLTDGEDLGESGLRAARVCAGRNVTVHCVGFGSALGAKIPVPGAGGETFLKDRSGAEVVSAMDPAGLRRIAGATGGEFVDALAGPEALVSVYEERIVPMARESFEAEERLALENRFQWPLLGALVLWMLDLWLRG